MNTKKETCFGSVKEAVEYISTLKEAEIGEYSVKIADKELREVEVGSELSKVLSLLPKDVFVSLDISECSALKRIDDSAFLSCHLSEIKFPESLEWIGRYAFDNFGQYGNHLSYVEIPKSVRHIGYDAFLYADEIQFREVFFWSRHPKENGNGKEPGDQYYADGIPLTCVKLSSHPGEEDDLLTGENEIFSYYDWDFYSY